MTDTRNSLHRFAVLLFAALVPVTLLVSASPAQAKWLSKPGTTVAGGAVAGGVGWSLRKNLGEAPERVREALDAFFRDDADGLEGTFQESLRLPGKIGIDAHLLLVGATRAGDAARNAKKNLEKRLESAKRWVDRLPGRAGDALADARAALAINRDERQWYESETRVLDKAPLPSVKVSRTRRAPDSSPGSLAEAWGMDAETIRRSRDPATWAPKPDPWGQDAGQGWDSPPAPPAATKADVWSEDAGEGEQSRPGEVPVARADPWGQDTAQGWASAAAAPIVSDVVGDPPVDTEWQNEYTTALSHFLDLDEDDTSYEAALVEVERLELEAVERERLAEQQRLEAQERERQARLEAQKRERQIARMEAELKSARAERRRQANTQAFVRGVQSAVSALQPMLDQTAALVQQDREARLRRDLARLREQSAAQARAKQEYAAIERQRQQAAEQQRRQAEKQARLERNLHKALNACDRMLQGSGFGCEEGYSSPTCDYYDQINNEAQARFERSKRECRQRAWDAYNRSGGGTILGVGRLE